MDEHLPCEFMGFGAVNCRSLFGSSHLLLKRSGLTGVSTIGPSGPAFPRRVCGGGCEGEGGGLGAVVSLLSPLVLKRSKREMSPAC